MFQTVNREKGSEWLKYTGDTKCDKNDKIFTHISQQIRDGCEHIVNQCALFRIEFAILQSQIDSHQAESDRIRSFGGLSIAW